MNVINNYAPVFSSFESQKKKLSQSINNDNKPKLNKQAIAIASFIGATAPVVAFNLKKGKLSEIKTAFSSNGKILNKVGKLSGLFEVDGIKEIGTSVLGSILCGLGAANMQDKNPDNRKERYKEGIYGFLNCIIPMGIVTGIETLMSKKGIKKNPLSAGASIALGLASGMFISNKVSNGINKKIFKGEDEFEKREMKLTDCLVHIDDILAVLVISKVPFANQIGKFLPFIYSHVGYETGTKK